jgi:phage terminase large subunit-like protein
MAKKQTRSRRTGSTEHRVHAYARKVVAGEIVAGPIVRDACKRHLRDLDLAHQRGLRFDEARADRALNFFPIVLRLNGGQFEGLPFELHDSQAFIIGSLFGWIRADGSRRFRVAYIEQGKGNGKSPLVAGIGLYGLVADEEPRAEVYSAASKKDQAMILFRDAVAMVEQSPALKRRLKQSGRDDKVWNLYDDQTNSFFRPISADQGQSGPRPHIGLIDELHEHKNASVINLMSAGRKWRRQPLIVAITNSGHDRTSVCWEYHEMARQVCAGALEDDTFFAFVCSLDEGDDPFDDEGCWIKANPLLGSVITVQYLRDEVNQARGMPSKESTVRRLNFCEWTEAHDPFVSLDSWKACASSFSLEDFAGSECYLSLDLSSTTDLTCANFLFVRDGIKWWVPVFWIPAEGLADRVKKDKVPYDVWIRQGHLQTTPGKVVDKDFVATTLGALVQQHQLTVRELAYDRWRIHEFQAACKRADVSFEMVEFGQGYQSMAPALDAFETDLTAGTFRHPNNPVLNWNAASAVVTRDPAGNRKLDKPKATGRIDGMVAGVMSHGRAALQSPDEEIQFFSVG